jgi:DNA-binding GntR family transcriptional regulator
LKPLQAGRGLLKDDAYERVKHLIQTQVFKPGTFLSERELAARLGMSKTPVRSALERLQSEGFVQISPQQGAVVREPSVHEIVDMIDFRIALEPHVLRRLAGRLSPLQLQRLRENLKQQEWVIEAHDVRRCAQLDADFHLMFCEYGGNREIARAMRSLLDRLFRTVLRVFAQDAARVRDSYREHLGIVDALEVGDGGQAAALMVAHLEHGKRLVVGLR